MIAELSLNKIHSQTDSIQSIIEFLSKSTNFNLECYKDGFLKRKIKNRLNYLNFTSYKEYFDYLLTNPSEFIEFRKQFTVNYTYYFRNQEIYKILMWYFLNGKIRRGDKNILRIWSVPCSTGEEPYSLAILFDYMKKNNKKYPNLKVEIVASDIDRSFIEHAKKGIYNSYSLHELPPLYASYFKQDHDKYEPKYILCDEIKEKVKFIQEDLTEGHAINQKYDIIFCRNLFIYLNRFSQEKVLKTISKHLISQGLLVVGKAELIYGSSFSHFKIKNPRHHIYSHLQ